MVDLQLEDGWTYSGPVVKGVPEGKGEEYGPNGEFYKGDFKQGKKCGMG